MSSSVLPFGLLTLGQSPRTDVSPTFDAILGGEAAYGQAGALDGKSLDEIRSLAPGPGETGIETRLADGAAVMLSRRKLLPLLAGQGKRLALGCRHVVLLCSGAFPELRRPDISLVEPVVLVRGIIKTLARGKTLGVVGPASDMAEAPEQWRAYARNVVTAAASPYGGDIRMVTQAAMAAESQGAHVLLLDDMGFTMDHAAAARSGVGIPVICATTATAGLMKEMV